MTDVLTEAQRRFNMSRIRGKDTKPEVRLRSMLHGAGLRYRLHVKTLPGQPDLVLARFRVAIFVHGCFWHSHGCSRTVTPKTRPEFWSKKLQANVERDRKNIEVLRKGGWRILTVWECALRGSTALQSEQLVQAVITWLYSSEPIMELPVPSRSDT